MELTRPIAMKHAVSRNPRTVRWICPVIAASLALLAVDCTHVMARGFDYGAPQRTINAGIIGDYSAQASGHMAWPYVFYQLSIRTDARPVGWTVVDPLAPHESTTDIFDKYGPESPLGSPITPEMGAYWDVSLHTTNESELRNFQILLLEISGVPTIGAQDVEKLRQFVDGGGILWIDTDASGYSLDGAGSFAGWIQTTFASDVIPATYGLGPSLAGGFIEGGIPGISSPYDLAQGQQFDTLPSLAPTICFPSGSKDTTDPFHFLGERQVNGDSSNDAYVGVGHLGAGMVVVTTQGVAAKVGATNVAVTGSSVAMLQLISDVIGESNSSLTALRGRQPAGSPGDGLGTSVLSTWLYSNGLSGGSSLGASYGRFAYIVNSDGTLHWLVLAPKGSQSSSEFGVNDGYTQQANLGAAPFSSPTIWPGYTTIDTSATTKPAYVDGGADGYAHIFVERADGTVVGLNTATGTPTVLPVAYQVGTALATASFGAFGTYVPAPIVYDHRVYATLPNGQLYIYDLTGGSAGGGSTYQGFPGAVPPSGGEIGMGSPVAGIVHDDCDNIVVGYSTNAGLYTVFAGARGEKLQDAGFDNNGIRMYAPKLTGATPMNPTNTIGQIDQKAPTSWRLYNLQPDGTKSFLTYLNPYVDTTGQHFAFQQPASGTATDLGASEVYGDYDVDWNLSQLASGAPAPAPGALDRIIVAPGSQQWSPPQTTNRAQMISSPVMDTNGDFFVIINDSVAGGTDSSILCLRDAYPQSNAKVLWRYRLPTPADYSWFVQNSGPSGSNSPTGLQDADGHDYSVLGSGLPGHPYAFVGAPVLDSRGNVYAAATDGTNSAIFSFNTNAQISVNLPVGQNAINPSVQVIQQSGGANSDEFGNTPTLLIGGANFNANSNGSIIFNNFAQPGNNYLYPFFSEGEPIQVQYTYANGQGTGAPPPNVPFHTNVAWCADLSASNNSKLPASISSVGVISGLAVVGDYLYFSTDQGHLFRLYTQNGSNPGGYLDMDGKNSAKKPILQDLGPTNVGVLPLSATVPSTGSVSASGTTVLVSGGLGVMNYQSEMTIVTDHNRLIGLDADGDAMFAVDSTDEVQTATGTPNASTHVPLNRPTDVTQLSTDRYLLADRGNNRCVEIDRQGNILWELSKFVDSKNLLTSGDPLTLNDPSSVQVWRDASYNVHYLIADSGNYRIVDVVDKYGIPPTHELDWVSATGNRNYRFEHAFRYVRSVPTTGASAGIPNYAIAALVTNKRIAPLTTSGGLSPSSFDSAGGSIVLLDAGFFNAVRTDVSASLPSSTTSGSIIGVVSAFQYKDPTGNEVAFAPKNPRFLAAYTPDAATMTAVTGYDGHDEFLYCDDNGAFDLDPVWVPATGSSYGEQNWWLGDSASSNATTGYKSLNTPIDTNGAFDRSSIPFVPTSIQRTGTDYDPQAKVYTGRYLISNPYTQGSVNSSFGNPGIPGFGGEVFLYSGQLKQIITDRTFSRPSNTSPLSQPTSAVFAK